MYVQYIAKQLSKKALNWKVTQVTMIQQIFNSIATSSPPQAFKDTRTIWIIWSPNGKLWLVMGHVIVS